MNKNYFSHKNMWMAIWNALNCGKVNISDYFIIVKYSLLFIFAKSYFIPRVMDTDSIKKKRSKKVIVKYLIPFISEKINEDNIEITPNITTITNSRIYFSFSRSVNDRDRLMKILLTQALSIGGIDITKNVKLDIANGTMMRFNIQDNFGSSEIVFEDVSVLAEIRDKCANSNKVIFTDDLDVLETFKKDKNLLSAELEAKFVLGIHVVHMDGRIMQRYKTKEEVLIERFTHFVRQLDRLLPYNSYKSNIDWCSLTKSNYYNIID